MSTFAMGCRWQLSAQVLSCMHAFRYEVFVERLKWSLPLIGGLEQDQYDTADARYVILSEGLDRVTACARLLPTTGAYMLPELFPQLLGAPSVPRDPAIWELSRFATSARETYEGCGFSLSKPTLEFLDLVFGFARWHDIDRLIFVTPTQVERLILRTGLSVHRIGAPATVHGCLSVALLMEIKKSRFKTGSDFIVGTDPLQNL